MRLYDFIFHAMGTIPALIEKYKKLQSKISAADLHFRPIAIAWLQCLKLVSFESD